jgi:tetratricopeptide (TPR) repeat protein/tRNA A-37 threonylcarbamoyl transferase component Bud32
VRKSPHGGLNLARWEQARALFDELTELPLDAQRARLARLASSDSSMAAEVQSLLAHDHSASDTIPQLVAEAAASVTLAAEDAVIPDRIGRYLVLSRLGAGGMGEVFLGEDAILGRRVALKRPASPLASDPAARARLLREARAAATITNPHACVVHEVGQDDQGRPFLAMEYLEGETLATRIARGPMPLDELLRLGIQAAGALEAAHAQGVVHRDIKPSNLMLTAHGVKLLDFGLASLTRDQPELQDGLLGTLPYMSPEQLEHAPVDERSDLFSLGVLLYEASTGRRPFEGGTPRELREAILSAVPHAPSTVVSDLPAGFDDVVLRLLEKAPPKRYSRAADVLRALRALQTPASRHRGRMVVIALLLAAAGGAVVWRVTPAVPSAPAERLSVVVAELTGTPDDAAAVVALREALVVQLQQTPFFTVFPRTRVSETLKLMGHPPDTALTSRLAREVAVRRGVPAWIAGSVTATSGGHRIVLTAARSQTGELLAQETVDVSARNDLVVGLGRAAFQLRARLGESQASLEQFSTPVEQATTGSLDAMKAYALGLQQGNAGDYALAASLFQRAVQIDPDFAMAWLALSREELNSSDSDRGIEAAARAYALRDRVSEQERARIEVRYHSSVSGDLERAVNAATAWQQTYPDEWWAYHTLSDLHFTRGDYARAEQAGRQAVRLNPDVAAAYSNLAGALFAQDRFAEARDVYQQAMARGFDAPEYHAFLWRIAYYSGDDEAMRRQEDWAGSSSTWAHNIPALAAALQGRWKEARTWSTAARTRFTTRGQLGLIALADRYDALTGAVLGDCGPARALSSPALARWPEEERAQVALAWALCGRVAEAQQLRHALELTRPDDTRIQRLWLPSIQAAAALNQGRPADAIEALRAATLPEGAGDSWPLFIRAEAHLRAGDASAAAADYAAIVARRGRTFWWPLVPLSHLGRARAAARAGDSTTARDAYEDFFAVWRQADPDLPVVIAARREQASLGRPQPR